MAICALVTGTCCVALSSSSAHAEMGTVHPCSEGLTAWNGSAQACQGPSTLPGS